MSRYTGPAYKKSRRVSISTLETGKDLVKRPYGPGQHGNARKGKLSNYGIQLVEKQKIRFTYGVSERQFQRLFILAKTDKKTPTGLKFLQILESRLDNLVFRMGFASTRRQARQLVNHGHILVNGKKVDIPSYLVSVNDVISFKEKSQNLKIVSEVINTKPSTPSYVEVNTTKRSGKFVRYPEREELSSEINEAQVIEFYNRKI